MISHGDVQKLRTLVAPEESVLSLYLNVPLDTQQRRELPARAESLIRQAAARSGAMLRADDEDTALAAVTGCADALPGPALAIFVSGHLGLREVVPLPDIVAERAVLAVRPHVRPLLAVLQHHPDHHIVVIDAQHAWLLTVTGDLIASVEKAPDEGEPSAGYGGWYLEPSHLQERVTELTRHLYWDAAAILGRDARGERPLPVVIGGQADSVGRLLAELPRAVLDCYAGSFAADPRLLTAARARDLAAPVIAHWAERRESYLVQEISGPSVSCRTAIGLDACIAAVNADAAALLLIADEQLVPGYICERCEALSRTCDGCCDWGAASRPIPDLLEEMAARTLHDGGDVISARVLPCGAAARLC